jgi:hypothetical protein
MPQALPNAGRRRRANQRIARLCIQISARNHVPHKVSAVRIIIQAREEARKQRRTPRLPPTQSCAGGASPCGGTAARSSNKQTT